jgi:hypothetical protein
MDSLFTPQALILGTVKNFEAIEILDELNNDINIIQFGPQNNISKVILDQGIGQDLTISGFGPNPTIEIKGDASATTDDLTVLVNNALVNLADHVNIILNANQNGAVEFGGLSTPGVESLSIHSTSQLLVKTGVVNNLEINDDFTAPLTITGDVTLDLNDLQFAVQTVNAQTFTGGLTLNDDFAGAVTINAGLTAGTSNILIVNNAANSVTLGNGNNTVVTGNGNDVINLGSGDNTVTAGGGQDDITFTVDTDDSDTVIYNAASDSSFSLPDIITGFTTGDFLDLQGVATFGAFNFSVVTSDVAVIAQMSALETANGAVDHVVFNSTTGHVYFDLGSDGALGAGDMEIHLQGTSALTAGQILT